MSEKARSLLALYETGDETGARSEAEVMLNVLVGSQSPDYVDWDTDGQVGDPGDGYGLLLNGDNSGYIQGSTAHAEFAATSLEATEQMQSHGEHVVIAPHNLEGWAPELRELLKQIVRSAFDASVGGLIRQAVALSNHMPVGVDINGNERIEYIAGEGASRLPTSMRSTCPTSSFPYQSRTPASAGVLMDGLLHAAEGCLTGPSFE